MVPSRLLAGARGRLLMFNLLVAAVTLAASAVAVWGFHHAGRLHEQAQAQTLSEMTGSMALARDTANVATAAVRLSQVVGALEYQSESARLQQTQLALQSSLRTLAHSPPAARDPALAARITGRATRLEQSVSQLLRLGHQRHVQRNQLLSALYQDQSALHHIIAIADRQPPSPLPADLAIELNRLLTIAIQIPSPQAVTEQIDRVMVRWPPSPANPLLAEKMAQFQQTAAGLTPLAAGLAESDLAIAYYTYRIKALVAALNEDINRYVEQVAQASAQRTQQTHRELSSGILFIGLFALLALVITGFAGFYIYRNLGSNLTAIAHAMTRLSKGERDVSVPALQRRDELGDLARAFNVFARNTASLEQASRLLKEKSTQLETTFQAMRDGFALFDHRGELVAWNPQYPLLLGLEARLLHRGQHHRDLLRRVDPPRQPWLGERSWEQALADLARQLPAPQEVRLHDGRVIELRFSPLPDGGMVNVVLERTERRALEQALAHSQKMKAVGQLTGGLAHDFNNLLAVIIGSLELAQQQPLEAQTAARIGRSLKAAERGAQLTQRLLAFSRKQSLQPQAVSLAALVENLRELLQHALPPPLALRVEAQPDAWPAWIDANQLENALLNLVMNARDAMAGRAGDIWLRIANRRVTRSGGRQQEMVVLEVEDRGCGMSDEVKAQVFEPFFTTKAVGQGSGLGLSMVYGFIRQSGGRVEIESQPGEGTRVQLQLPRAPSAAPAAPTPVPCEEPPPSDRLVLVLEDEEDVRQTLCEQLHRLGYLTLECATGAQALALLAQTPDIGLLISDLMLPGESGAEVVRQAQARYPALATLLVSGQDRRQASEEPLPACERLRKPYTQRQLADALHRAWARQARDFS